MKKLSKLLGQIIPLLGQFIKNGKLLSKFFLKKSPLINQRGQTIVEFVLLLVVISGLSYGFVFSMNSILSNYWSYSANLVINDKPGVKTVTLD